MVSYPWITSIPNNKGMPSGSPPPPAAVLHGCVSLLQVEQSSHLSVTDSFGYIAAFRLSGSDLSGHGQVELADLLLQRHLFH